MAIACDLLYAREKLTPRRCEEQSEMIVSSECVIRTSFVLPWLIRPYEFYAHRSRLTIEALTTRTIDYTINISWLIRRDPSRDDHKAYKRGN
jgi:hypothetical protein